MTALTDWASGLCAAGVGTTLLFMLCPDGPLKKALRVLTAMLFFACLLSPLGMLREVLRDGMTMPSSPSAQVSQSLNEQVDEQVQSVLEQVLKADADERLASMNIPVKNVHIERDTAKENSIYIKRVRVVFDKNDHPVPIAAKQTLEKAWGVPVEVYYSDAKDNDDN